MKKLLLLLPFVYAGVITGKCSERWGSGCIPFVIDKSIESRRDQILDAIDILNRYTNAGFADYHNRTIPSSYILIRDGSSCSSSIGKQPNGQAVNLDEGCGTLAMVHELMHAIGIFHEQAREDRDLYIDILWENIQENRDWNFRIRTPSEIPPVPYADYDYDSVMHYGEYFFSKNGGKTISARGNKVGQFRKVSDLDFATVNYALLECGSNVPVESSCSYRCYPNCRNLGKCKDNICMCRSTKSTHFYGNTCEEKIDCSSPCEGENSFCGPGGTCVCYYDESVHYIGNECEIKVECPRPCKQGVLCSEKGTCECPDGYEGSDCGTVTLPVGPVGIGFSIILGIAITVSIGVILITWPFGCHRIGYYTLEDT